MSRCSMANKLDCLLQPFLTLLKLEERRFPPPSPLLLLPPPPPPPPLLWVIRVKGSHGRVSSALSYDQSLFMLIIPTGGLFVVVERARR